MRNIHKFVLHIACTIALASGLVSAETAMSAKKLLSAADRQVRSKQYREVRPSTVAHVACV